MGASSNACRRGVVLSQIMFLLFTSTSTLEVKGSDDLISLCVAVYSVVQSGSKFD